MKDKRVIVIIIILGVIFTILGGSLAYWSWQSTNAEKTNVTFTVGSTFSCSANGGGNITNTNYLVPTDCDNETYAIKKEITVNTTSQVTNEIINLSMDLNIDSISPALLQTDYFMYALTKNANSCNGAISGGSFKDNYDSVNHTVPLLTNEEFIGTESKTYYLYIWLDKDETNSNTMNTSFSASLEGSCTDSGNILKKYYANLGIPGTYFKDAAYRDNITSVSFVNEINIPDNATNWDVGTSPSNASDVKAWLEDDGSGNNKFALKIGANGTIFALNLVSAFCDMRNASNFDFSSLNTSETTDMHSMFSSAGRNASNFDLNLGNHFDTSNVVNMHNMFYMAGYKANTFNLNLGNQFNTSNVTNMGRMFKEAGGNSTNWNLNLGNQFDTSRVIDMGYMFDSTGHNTSIYQLRFGNQFNTSNVTNMYGMFNSVGINTINWYMDLGNNFNTIKVTDMSNMFRGAGVNSNTFSLDLGAQFNTSNVTNMSNMFSYAGRWAKNFNVNLGNQFNTSRVTNTYNMFSYMGQYTQTRITLDLSAGDFNNVTNNRDMFASFTAVKATIYVKDATAQSFIIAQNNGFSASNVLIK